MIRGVLLVLLISLSLTGISVDKYSILDGGGIPGNWTNGGYWSNSSGGAPSGVAPSSSDNINVETDVTLNVNLIGGDAISGILTINAGSSLSTTTKDIIIKTGGYLYVYGTLEVQNLQFDKNSVIYVGEGGVIIVHNTFANKNNSDNVKINGSVSADVFNNGQGGIVEGSGSITANAFEGSGTTFGVANKDIAPGSTVSEDLLPIELLGFTVKAIDNSKVELNWSTCTEINNDFFTIERSNDGVIFEEIDYIEGAGNSNRIINYSQIDYNPNNGINYYRLKQTDFNGDFEYFNIEVVNLSIEKETSVSLYPNPVNTNNLMSYSIDGLLNNLNVEIIINDMLGRVVFSENLSSDENGLLKGSIDINSEIPKGNYILISNSNGNLNRSKFIVN